MVPVVLEKVTVIKMKSAAMDYVVVPTIVSTSDGLMVIMIAVKKVVVR